MFYPNNVQIYIRDSDLWFVSRVGILKLSREKWIFCAGIIISSLKQMRFSLICLLNFMFSEIGCKSFDSQMLCFLFIPKF